MLVQRWDLLSATNIGFDRTICRVGWDQVDNKWTRYLLIGPTDSTPSSTGNEVEVDDSPCKSFSVSLPCCSLSHLILFWGLKLDTDFFRVDFWGVCLSLFLFWTFEIERGLPRLELKIINQTYRQNTRGNIEISSWLTQPYLIHNWRIKQFKYMIYECDLLNWKRVVICQRKNWLNALEKLI